MMRNPALQRYYYKSTAKNAAAPAAQAPADNVKLSAIAEKLKSEKNNTESSQLRPLSKPVLFAKRNDGDAPNIAVVFGDASDLRELSCVKTALAQTYDKAGIFAEIEVVKFYKIDQIHLNNRMVNIDAIDVNNISAEDTALILEAIIALSENNSFRKTNLPMQVDALLDKIYQKYPEVKPATLAFK